MESAGLARRLRKARPRPMAPPGSIACCRSSALTGAAARREDFPYDPSGPPFEEASRASSRRDAQMHCQCHLHALETITDSKLPTVQEVNRAGSPKTAPAQ